VYVKCVKNFFGTINTVVFLIMLNDLGLASFNTVSFTANLMCDTRLKSSVNSLVQTAVLVQLSLCVFFCTCVFVCMPLCCGLMPEINVHSFNEL